MSAQPHQPPRQRWLVPVTIGLAVLIGDQLTKAWAATQLGPHPRERVLAVIGDWLSLVYSHNTGVAFGLFQNMPQLFTATSILITVGAVYAYAHHMPSHNRVVQIAMGLIVGGALGNIIDRVRLGYVVDFISVGWWPVFNLADSAITVGVTLLASYLIFVGDEPAPTPRPAPRDDGLLSDLLSRDVD
ncbi:MAG: signal peptidase II [Chloroflexales bacterium]|nr:signal peptidase II [Chloroflexales bacterium]